MRELYSKGEDCLELGKKLKKEFGNKIEFETSAWSGLVSGKYFSRNGRTYSYGEGLDFYYKYCKDGFLRIQIGSYYRYNHSFGEKLAALSDFYEVLSEEFGEPTAFYTTKDDEEGMLSFHWSFVDKEEDIKKFKAGTFFDDAETDSLIIIGEEKEQANMKDQTRHFITRKIGLPFELLPLVDEHIEDFVRYKKGKELRIPEGSKIDGVPVVSYEKKLSNRR